MKKIVSFLLILAVLVGVAYAVVNQKAYPEELIYNYMEGSTIAITVLNADDYVVAVISNSKLIYDKKTEKIKSLSQTVFDQKERGTKLICSKRNLLYYLAIDEVTGGSAMFELNLDTLEKRKIDTKNAISSLDAFLGTDKVLGIEQGGNDVLITMMKDVWMSKRGRYDKNFIKDFLTQKDNENKFGVSEISKICTTDDYIFFINELSILYRYSHEENAFKKISDDRVTDFFITNDKVYFYSADNGDSLFLTTYDGQGKKKVTSEKLIDVHVRNGKSYGQTEGGKIYEIDNEKCTKMNIQTGSSMWDTDGQMIYIFNNELCIIESYSLIGC